MINSNTAQVLPLDMGATPRELYDRLASRHDTVLLESARLMPGLGEWSYVTGPAAGVLETRGGRTELRACGAAAGDAPLAQWTDPFRALDEVLAALRAPGAPAGAPAFTGGLAGWLGYDLVRAIERLPARVPADPEMPEMRLLLADHVFALEHATGRWWLCMRELPWSDASVRSRVRAESRARALAKTAPAPRPGFSAGELVSRTPSERYLADVARVVEYIHAGDVFQVNLSHRLETAFAGDPWALYCALADANPAPFAAYIETAAGAIASFSPERFLRLAGREVSARPIKGTRARAADPQDDARARDLLAASEKDRAENLMIVDLMRNDLGRVARPGSVRVDELWKIEAHPSVWQMVSTLRAELREGVDAAGLLRACWPPGSMTGAPKVRAMQIIEELEPVRRGPYAGSIGWFDAAGGMDLSVVIRTVLLAGDRLMLQLGGGVVADSRPEEELAESLDKGRFLMRALGSTGSMAEST